MTPKGSAARRLRNGALMCAALVLVVLTACEGSSEPTEQAVRDPEWVDRAIEAGFPAELVPWLADPGNRGTLPSSPDLRARYVNALDALSWLDRERLLILGLGWTYRQSEALARDFLSPTPTPLPWGERWVAYSEGGANGVVAEATAVRGRAVGADLWIKCYEDIRSTEVTIIFRFADYSGFAGERFEATAEAAREAWFPILSARNEAEATAEAAGDADAQATAEAAREASDAHWATAEAAGAAATAEAVSDTEVRDLIATVVAAATARAPRAPAAYAGLEPLHRAAAAVDDSIDEIFISRRAVGEPGRWMKSGWKHYPTLTGYVVLEQAPAAAFIQQLSEVEEFAVLVTHDSGEDTAAVFDVRYLDAALGSLGSPFVLGFGKNWDC